MPTPQCCCDAVSNTTALLTVEMRSSPAKKSSCTTLASASNIVLPEFDSIPRVADKSVSREPVRFAELPELGASTWMQPTRPQSSAENTREDCSSQMSDVTTAPRCTSVDTRSRLGFSLWLWKLCSIMMTIPLVEAKARYRSSGANCTQDICPSLTFDTTWRSLSSSREKQYTPPVLAPSAM